MTSSLTTTLFNYAPSSSASSPPPPSRASVYATFNSKDFYRHRSTFNSLRGGRRTVMLCMKSPTGDVETTEWIKKLPDKTKALYSHSLPCIEAWLKQLGFRQSKDDRAVWFVEKDEWHAQLSLDVTDLHIRYLKSGPGDLDKDVDRRFSYALSREDIENAILGGP